MTNNKTLTTRSSATRWLLLTALILTMGMGWSLEATAQTSVTVCDGTASNQFVPFFGYYADADQHNQMIFPATDLTAVTGAITQMVFYIDPSADNGEFTAADCLGTWTVSLGETTATTLDGLDDTTPLTQVYEGYFDCSTGTLTLDFDEGYFYQGGNLLVDITHAAAEYNTWYFLGESATGASYTYGDQRDFLPKTTFAFDPDATPPAGPKPTALAAALTPGDGTIATLNWAGSASAMSYTLQYGTDAEFDVANTTEQTGITETSIDLTSLTAEATYYARVKAVYDGGESAWSRVINFKPTAIISYLMPTDGSTLPVALTAENNTVNLYDDGGADGNYSNDAVGYIKLNAPAGYIISISGTVKVEGYDGDELYIYDGETTEANLLIGPDDISDDGDETTLSKVKTTGQTALLRFYSDVNVNYAGFALTATLVDATTPHDITVGNHEDGSLTANQTSATAGTTVTVTATPNPGYVLTNITVTATEGGATVAQQSFSAQDEAEWTFQMPNKAVTVSATFVAEGDYAATITSGGITTGYYHFADVVDAFNNDYIADGSTLTLLDDVTTGRLEINADDITLDLNGQTLTATEGGVLTINGCNFTLTDSGTGGTIDATGHDYPLDLYGAGATIVGGTVKADDYLVYLNTATTSCTIIGGTFTALSGNKSVYVDNGTLTITGGTYTGMVFMNYGNVTISGGTITKANEDDRCAHNENGTMTISGGKFTGEVENYATTTISGGYFSEDPTAGADPATLADDCTLVSESGVVGYPYAVKGSLNLLNDDSGAAKTNSQLLAENNGNLRDVTLSGRTLAKDGSWNTLCLPFALTPAQIAASELSGATIKRLDNTAGTGSNLDAEGTLTLKFIDVEEDEDLVAGVPYIVKFANEGGTTADLVFSGVQISVTAPVPVTFANGVNPAEGKECQFVGQYSNFAIDADNINEIVMLGAGNMLGYSQNPRDLKAFRCHFLVPTAEPAPGAPQQAARRYVIDFGDESTAIRGTEFTEPTEGTEAVYTLQGIRIAPEAMQKGSVYIVRSAEGRLQGKNGKKMIKK